MSEATDLPLLHRQPLPWTAVQPIKAIFLLSGILFLVFIQIPFWLLIHLLPSLRPLPSWTYRQATTQRTLRAFFPLLGRARVDLNAPVSPGQLGGPASVFERIDPLPASSLQGPLSPTKTSVRPAARPGNWYPSLYDPARDAGATVLLYFFGGGYVLGNHVFDPYRGCFDRLRSALGGEKKKDGAVVKAFSVGYRLASARGNHFPAQLMDMVAAYRHVLAKGVEPANVVFIGDSAGANLVIATLRYLVACQDELELPAAAILACPWVDMDLDFEWARAQPCWRSEIVLQEVVEWGMRALVPANMKLSDEWFSPVNHPLRVPIPLWIQADDNEVFCQSIIKFARAMQDVEGNVVRLHISHNGTHGTFLPGGFSGWHTFMDEYVASIKEFFEEQGVI